jgi:hypothetical protein
VDHNASEYSTGRPPAYRASIFSSIETL